MSDLADLYRRVMKSVDHGAAHYDFETQRFSVRSWDGIDGCWSDLATDVAGKEALRIWAEHTDAGTRRVRFADIDYVRIFPAKHPDALGWEPRP